MNAQAQKALEEDSGVASDFLDNEYYRKASMEIGYNKGNRSQEQCRQVVLRKAKDHELQLASLSEEKETITRKIRDKLAQYNLQMSNIDYDISIRNARRSVQNTCVQENVPVKIACPITMLIGGQMGPGLNFCGTGSFAKKAQSMLRSSFRTNRTMSQLITDLQRLQSDFETSSSTPTRNPPTLQALLRNALKLNTKGFESVGPNSLFCAAGNAGAVSNLFGSKYFKNQRYFAIESEMKFFVSHLLRWLQLNFLMTVPEFETAIQADWFATEFEGSKTTVTDRKSPKYSDLKYMSTQFHTAVANLEHPKDMITLLRKQMRMFLFFSMPSKKPGVTQGIDLQKFALENRVSDQHAFNKYPDAWLASFKCHETPLSKVDTNERAPRGSAWPGDINVSTLPAVLVSLLLILYKGHIHVLDEFDPAPASSVPQILKTLQERLARVAPSSSTPPNLTPFERSAQEQKEQAYANLDLEAIMQEMDEQVLVCFLPITCVDPLLQMYTDFTLPYNSHHTGASRVLNTNKH